MTTTNPASLQTSPDAAAEHLDAARLHLKRCLIEVKAAAQAEPSLVVKLGSKHAALADVLRDLEQRP